MELPLPIDEEILERVKATDVPWNRYGLDPFGFDQRVLAQGLTLSAWFYRHYFNVTVYDIDKVPVSGRIMLVGNHTGGLPVDGMMVGTSLILEREPPRLAHAMVERFLQDVPFITPFFRRSGQLMGLPEHAVRLLEAERALMVFPEGARGTGKLYRQKYELVRFGTGFMRLAMETGTPIVPFGFLGGVEALPVMHHSKLMARLIGAPYFPVTPYIVPLPRPFPCHIQYGDLMRFEGDGTEPDEVIVRNVEAVKDSIRGLIDEGLRKRRGGA